MTQLDHTTAWKQQEDDFLRELMIRGAATLPPETTVYYKVAILALYTGLLLAFFLGRNHIKRLVFFVWLRLKYYFFDPLERKLTVLGRWWMH